MIFHSLQKYILSVPVFLTFGILSYNAHLMWLAYNRLEKDRKVQREAELFAQIKVDKIKKYKKCYIVDWFK